MSNGEKYGNTTFRLAERIKEEFPEIEYAVRIGSARESFFTYGNKKFAATKTIFVDPDFLKVFSFSFVAGNPKNALEEPRSMICSESFVRKAFGKENPIGKKIKLNTTTDVTVSGIIKDIPAQSHLHANCIVSMDVYASFFSPQSLDYWQMWTVTTYVLLHEGKKSIDIEKKLPGFIARYEMGWWKTHLKYQLQPLKKIHLYSSSIMWDFADKGNIGSLLLFWAVGLLILIVASINYMNLATAQYLTRGKETGIKKMLGSKRSIIVLSFLMESLIIVFFALILAFALCEVIFPWFNELTGKQIQISYTDWKVLLFSLFIIITTTFFSGLYPAFFLSSFKPITAIKNEFQMDKHIIPVRKILVIFQFFIGILLMICLGILFMQLRYIYQKDLGFIKERLISLPRSGEIMKQLPTFRHELLEIKNVVNVSFSDLIPPGIIGNFYTAKCRETNTQATVKYVSVYYHYFETLGVEVKAGREYSEKFSSDSINAYVINESAARNLDISDPVGKTLQIGDNASYIIGVVKDFHYQSLHDVIEPIVFIFNKFPNYTLIRIADKDAKSTINQIEKIWNKYERDLPFNYQFIDERFNSLYNSEKRVSDVFSIFLGISLLIACLGLFGLSVYTTERRTKEIGIRKVNGANTFGIMYLLSADFTKLVMIAYIIAVPVAYYVMNKWLQNYAYHTRINIWVFVFAWLLTFAIALLTICWQAWRAANRNPVDSLRYE
jgi:putative ABC transport system permease protein